MTRVDVLKTYKIYVNGSFPRTESGRYYKIFDKNKKWIANACLCSRKDIRDAVVAAQEAFGSWNATSAFLKSQIIYRMAEMLEGRKLQFSAELELFYKNKRKAEQEVLRAIDRIVYFAGWADKFQQVFSAVNPVAGNYFNFSLYEPTGVVGIISQNDRPLLGLVSSVLPVIVSGNTGVVIASETFPISAISFAEVLATSDLPKGVINILTGRHNELIEPLSTHMNIQAISYTGKDKKIIQQIQHNAALNVKRVHVYAPEEEEEGKGENPYRILDFCEVKTTWHPIENIQPAGGGY